MKREQQVEIEEIDNILDDIYILEYFDEQNVDMCPENAKWETIEHIKLMLGDGIEFRTKLKDGECCETVGEYIAEEYDDAKCLCLNWDGEYLSP